MTYTPLLSSELAAVVTSLEMHARPEVEVPPSPLSLKHIDSPQPDAYRELFRLIGAPGLWFSRLIMDDATLAAIIQHPRLELFAVIDENGHDVGMLELDFREPGQCELPFIGLIPELSSQGHGRSPLAAPVP